MKRRGVAVSRRAFEGMPRRIALALIGILLSFAIVSGFARANGRYFYCEAMGLMATDPCANAAQRGEQRDSTEARSAKSDCCEVITLPSLPTGATTTSLAVPPPALVALVPATPLLDLRLGDSRAHLDRGRERWRSTARSAAQARARLMVFLT